MFCINLNGIKTRFWSAIYALFFGVFNSEEILEREKQRGRNTERERGTQREGERTDGRTDVQINRQTDSWAAAFFLLCCLLLYILVHMVPLNLTQSVLCAEWNTNGLAEIIRVQINFWTLKLHLIKIMVKHFNLR